MSGVNSMTSTDPASPETSASGGVPTVAVTKIGSLTALHPEDRGEIGVVELPADALGPEDVRIDVAYAAICGSDPHLAEGFFGTDVPIGLGHEISGVVAEVGPTSAVPT
ncbi:alcohol dehydrogenase catalytic domain-containing protein [Nesterenkonia pannonica]|uniref:alcohol dehydrogenase catalytic domain-containing protein n=1 Tax=Nesterenkonia pannonica TaxID=1548602 RepID=UPI0021642ED4|nr:alcohol dehydrogenase catalytic domain-containing protein [Nesterenkonia pannonica]